MLGLVVSEEPWRRRTPGKGQALRHLEALEQRRPIDSIADLDERAAAGRAREWIRRILLEVPADPEAEV